MAFGGNENYAAPPHDEKKYLTLFSFMSSIPLGLSPLRLPLGEIVFYPTGRPSIRSLTREIAALGYEVSGFPLHHTDLRPLPPGVWHWGPWRYYLIYCRSHGAVVVGFVFGPERLRLFLPQRARLG